MTIKEMTNKLSEQHRLIQRLFLDKDTLIKQLREALEGRQHCDCCHCR
jgi:hypothetical protein